MPDSRIPAWTLKNVPPEARNAAIAAAKRANTPIGAWVARVLLEAAQREATEGRALVVVSPAAEAMAVQEETAKNTLDRLETLARVAAQLDGLKARGSTRVKSDVFKALSGELRRSN